MGFEFEFGDVLTDERTPRSNGRTADDFRTFANRLAEDRVEWNVPQDGIGDVDGCVADGFGGPREMEQASQSVGLFDPWYCIDYPAFERRLERVGPNFELVDFLGEFVVIEECRTVRKPNSDLRNRSKFDNRPNRPFEVVDTGPERLWLKRRRLSACRNLCDGAGTVSSSGDDLSGLSAELGDAYDELRGDSDVEAETDGGVLTSITEEFSDEWSVRRMVFTMVPLLAALSVLQMASGTVLETFEDTLLENPSLLILVPVQIGTAGNLASIMCSRLSTQLHLGTFELSLTNHGVRANSGGVFALAATVFGVVGVAAWAIGTALGGVLTLVQVLTISLVSGMLLALLVVVLSLVSVSASYRLGFNPDDTTIPLVTNLCDIAGVLILFAVVVVVL